MHDLIRKAMEIRKKKNVKEGYELLVDHIVKVYILFVSLYSLQQLSSVIRMGIFLQACLQDSIILSNTAKRSWFFFHFFHKFFKNNSAWLREAETSWCYHLHGGRNSYNRIM